MTLAQMVSLARREISERRGRKEILVPRLPFLVRLVLLAHKVFRALPARQVHRLGSRVTLVRLARRTRLRAQPVRRVQQVQQDHLVVQPVQLVSLARLVTPVRWVLDLLGQLGQLGQQVL